MNLDTHELAWAAGFIDGEGWIGGQTLQLTASQVDRRVLDRLQKALGLGTVSGPHKRNRTYRKSQPQYCLNICNFEHAQAAICFLWKWLSPVKRQQALTAMRKYAERPLTYKHRARISKAQKAEIIAQKPTVYTNNWAAQMATRLGISVSSIRRVIGFNS